MPAPETPEAKLAYLRLCWAAVLPLPAIFLATAFVAKTPKASTHIPLPVLAVAGVVIFALSIVGPKRRAHARLARFPVAADATPEQRTRAAYQLAAVALMAGIGPAIAVTVAGLMALLFESAGWLAAPFFVASYVALALQLPTHEKTLALLDA